MDEKMLAACVLAATAAVSVAVFAAVYLSAPRAEPPTSGGNCTLWDQENSFFFQGSCKKTKTGWDCTFNNEAAVDLFEQRCNEGGGSWSCYGFCMPEYTHSCDCPYPDAGKACSNSQQCEGKCVADMEYVLKTYPNRQRGADINCGPLCNGRCSEYPLRFCDWWYEVNDGKIEDNTGVFCD